MRHDGGVRWHVRDSSDGDLDALADVFRRASLSNRGGEDLLRAHPEVLELDGPLVLAGDTRVLVDGGQVLGFSRIDVSGGRAELEDLFVDPDRQGEGLGRALLDDAAAAALAGGADQIEVTANPEALGFYLAVGFEETGVVDTPLGVTAPRLRLWLGR